MAVWILTLYIHTHTHRDSNTDTTPLLRSLEQTLSVCECVCGAYHACVVTSKKAPSKTNLSLLFTFAGDVAASDISAASKLWSTVSCGVYVQGYVWKTSFVTRGINQAAVAREHCLRQEYGKHTDRQWRVCVINYCKTSCQETEAGNEKRSLWITHLHREGKHMSTYNV